MLKFIEVPPIKIETEKKRVSRGSNNNKFDISFNLERIRATGQSTSGTSDIWIFDKSDRVFTVGILGIRR